ncbi:MAG: nitroreductase family protein [Pseudobacteriovorax sp.]|nr:nitroreductase family protein [Pseudobacteriovorax sp.]
MTVIDTLLSHRSIRKFQDRDISESLLNELLQSAIEGSSSSGNLNSYSIIVSRDLDRRKALCKMHANQSFIEEAPVLLTFIADQHRTRTWLRQRGAVDNFAGIQGFLVAAFDALIVAQSLSLAAESKGLGLCYLGTTLSSADQLISFFNLPPGTFPVTSIALGFPGEDPTPRSRLPMDALVHQEVYQGFDKGRIDTLYAEKEVSGWKRYMEIPGIKEKIEEYGIKNLAQFYTSAIKYSPKYHDETSQMLIEQLKRQDYFNVIK